MIGTRGDALLWFYRCGYISLHVQIYISKKRKNMKKKKLTEELKKSLRMIEDTNMLFAITKNLAMLGYSPTEIEKETDVNRNYLYKYSAKGVANV
jgi:hypothetical protein